MVEPTYDRRDRARWKHEAAFFDNAAIEAIKHIRPAHPDVVRRYGTLRRRRFSKEYRFRLLGDVRGKSVLDVGCGDGLNALNFALLGATVTGIDISSKAIELAKRHAEVNGVSAQTRFVCSPLELADFPEASFDIVWGDAILHHLIPDLDLVVGRMRRWVKPGGVIMFGEPVNFNPTLRAIRLMLPIHTDATPDERPLEMAEIEVIRRHLPNLQIRPFSLFDRVTRWVLGGYDYERASAVRQRICDTLALMDYAVLSIPGLRSLGANSVMYERVPS